MENITHMFNTRDIIKIALVFLTALVLTISIGENAMAAMGVKVSEAETNSVTAPFVTRVSPEDGGEDVALDAKIMAVFNKKMREEDINEFTVTLNDGISDISTTVKYNNELMKVIITPLENLQANHGYYVTISRTVRDLNGATMLSDKVWKFTSVRQTDKNPPVIVDVSPTVSASNVACNSKVEVMFNKKMFEASINENTITLKRGDEKIVGAIRYYSDVNKAVFAPINPLKPGSVFEVNISNQISDASRNCLARAYSYTFKTSKEIAPGVLADAQDAGSKAMVESGNAQSFKNNANIKKLIIKKSKNGAAEVENQEEICADSEAGSEESSGARIEIVEMFPAPGADMINTDEKIKVKFNKKMNPGTFNIFNFSLQDNNEYIFGKIEYDVKTLSATFIPAGALKMNRKYRVNVSEKLEDAYGNRLERDYSWEFTTIKKIATAKVKEMFQPLPDGNSKDNVGPNVISVSPRDNAENVNASTQVCAVFDEKIKDFSLNSFTFRVLQGDIEVSGKIYYDTTQKKAIFTPKQPFMDGWAYTAQITPGVMDLSGNYMQREKKWKFIVGKGWNKRSPAIVRVAPEKGDTDVDLSSSIIVEFDRNMKATSITPYSFVVTDGTRAAQGKVYYDEKAKSATFAPWSAFLPNKVYNVTLAKTIEDSEGMTLSETQMWQFKTGSGLKSKMMAQANVTSIAAESDANMQVKVQKAMGSEDFTAMAPVGSPAAIEAKSELGNEMNASVPSQTKISELVPVYDVKERLSVSDKGAYGNVTAKRVADTIDNSEIKDDTAPDEMARRYQTSDKGAYGKTDARRIKDSTDKTDVLDDAAAETLKDQIAKFLSDDEKTNNKLAAGIDKLPSNNEPVAEANAGGVGTVPAEGENSALESNMMETPHEASAAFNKDSGDSPDKVKADIANRYNSKNETYTREDGTIYKDGLEKPKTAFTQMSEPPSNEKSIYSANPVQNQKTVRQPKLSGGEEGLIKLENAVRYNTEPAPETVLAAGNAENSNAGQSEETSGAVAGSSENMQQGGAENGYAAAVQPPDTADGNAASDIVRPAVRGGEINSSEPASIKENNKMEAFNPPKQPSPKGMINGIPVEELLADSKFENVMQKMPETDQRASEQASNKDEKEHAQASGEKFKTSEPNLSDVGFIPRDGGTQFFIVAIYPNKNSDNIKTDSSVTAVFSQDIDVASLNGTSFKVTGDEGSVNGKLLYNQRMKKAIFRPAQPLASGVTYSIELTSAVKSSSGQALMPLKWNFKTR